MSTAGLCLWKEKRSAGLAKALEGKVKLRLPWYEPTYKLPADPIIAGNLNKEFDTLVIDEAPDRPRLVASTGSEVAAG